MNDPNQRSSWKTKRASNLIIIKRRKAFRHRKLYPLRVTLSFYIKTDAYSKRTYKRFEGELFHAFETNKTGIVVMEINGIEKKPFREYTVYANEGVLDSDEFKALMSRYTELNIDVFGKVDRWWREYTSF